MWNAAAACSVAFERTREALTTFAPVRRATSRQKIGPSSPCSWTIDRPTASTVPAISSSVALTKTPHSWTVRRSAAPIACASASSQRRGEPSQKIIPSAHAPASAARCASSRLVIPQCLMRVAMRLIVERAAAGAAGLSRAAWRASR